MAKSGPQKTPTEVLKKRGSWVAKAREKAARAPHPRKLAGPKRRPVRKIRDLIRSLPGYDPFAQAGDCTFSERAAKKALAWFEGELSHVKGEKARQPLHLEDWQRAIVCNVFGWVRPDGTRRYRKVFLFVPRKNGKSCMAAGFVLYSLFEDGEHAAEVYGAASTYSQACLIFEHARGMVAQNPKLSDPALSKTFNGQAKAIQLLRDWSTYRPIAAESLQAHGFNSSAYMVDELHALADTELLDVLDTSTGARRQPLAVLITTSDYEREGSPCNEVYNYACKVRDGIIEDGAFLPVIYEASVDDDWEDPAVWRKANPNLGVSVSEQYIADQCKKAKDNPRFENTFKRLHLNIRTQQDVRWLPMDRWDACAGEPLALEDFVGRVVMAGLDLSTTRDMTALVLAALGDEGRIELLPIFWLPRETALAREKRDRVPYTKWIREGWIRETTGNTTDYATIRRDINELINSGVQITEIAADRLFQGDQLVQELRDADGLNVTPHGQGFVGMAAPTKRFEDLVMSGRLRHGGNPVLRWHASNVSVEQDAAGNLKPSRRKSTEKIDGIVSSIMAVGLVREDQYQELQVFAF